MQTLDLSKRPAKIGGAVNTRTEKHGKEEVTAQDITLSGILLTVEELIAITDEESAGQGLFKMEGDQYVPRFLNIESFKLETKFVEGVFKMSGGVPATTYKNVKVKSCIVMALGGGMTELSCMVQVYPKDTDPSAQSLVNKKVNITLKAQLKKGDDEENGDEDDDPELPLDHQKSLMHEDGDAVPIDLVPKEEAEHVYETGMSRTGRKVQRAARKAAKKKK